MRSPHCALYFCTALLLAGCGAKSGSVLAGAPGLTIPK
jgi:hypothetical protein